MYFAVLAGARLGGVLEARAEGDCLALLVRVAPQVGPLLHPLRVGGAQRELAIGLQLSSRRLVAELERCPLPVVPQRRDQRDGVRTNRSVVVGVEVVALATGSHHVLRAEEPRSAHVRDDGCEALR